MGWLQWKGEQWETTEDEAQLNVHLRAPDTGGKRFNWTWHLFQNDPIFHADRTPPRRWFSVELSDLGFEGDWRQFSGRELRGHPAWQEEHEHFGEYGHLFVPRIEAWGDHRQAERDDEGHGFWTGHDFILRFGQREGYVIPCELDGWVQPRSEYYRKTPETSAELALPPSGEPNLRVVARTRIGKATVHLPRCGDDPVPLARQYLEEFTGLTDLPVTSIEWWGPKLSGQKEAKAPGWRSTVEFEIE